MNTISREELNSLRERYPPRSRVLLHGMVDDPCPVPPGTEGILEYIDDAAQFHVAWFNGQGLAAIYGVDDFEVTPPDLPHQKTQGCQAEKGRTRPPDEKGG